MGKPAFINRSVNKIGRWLVRQKTELFLNENIGAVEKREKSLNVNGERCLMFASRNLVEVDKK